jgi:hypothetical protein
MGLSRAFGCFKDPEARTRKKQKKAGKRTHYEEAQPNRVVASAGIEMRSLPVQSPLPAAITVQNCEPPPPELLPSEPSLSEPAPSAPGIDDELEPWSVGAVIRRTSLLIEMANQRKQAEEEAKANYQATVEEEEGEIPSTPDMTSSWDRVEGEGGGIVRATTMFGLPTVNMESEEDFRVIEAEAAARRFMDENNAIAAKGSHNGKYGGAIGWNSRYSQRTAPMPLYGRDMRNSGWGWAGSSRSYSPYAYMSGPTD